MEIETHLGCCREACNRGGRGNSVQCRMFLEEVLNDTVHFETLGSSNYFCRYYRAT